MKSDFQLKRVISVFCVHNFRSSYLFCRLLFYVRRTLQPDATPQSTKIGFDDAYDLSSNG